MARSARSLQLQPLFARGCFLRHRLFGASILVLPKCPDPKQEVSAVEPSGPNRRQGRSAQWSLSGPLVARLLPPAGASCEALWHRGRGQGWAFVTPEAAVPASSGQGLLYGAGLAAVAWAAEQEYSGCRRGTASDPAGRKMAAVGGAKWRRDPWGGVGRAWLENRARERGK